jgi:hypothetical protein
MLRSTSGCQRLEITVPSVFPGFWPKTLKMDGLLRGASLQIVHKARFVGGGGGGWGGGGGGGVPRFFKFLSKTMVFGKILKTLMGTSLFCKNVDFSKKWYFFNIFLKKLQILQNLYNLYNFIKIYKVL